MEAGDIAGCVSAACSLHMYTHTTSKIHQYTPADIYLHFSTCWVIVLSLECNNTVMNHNVGQIISILVRPIKTHSDLGTFIPDIIDFP